MDRQEEIKNKKQTHKIGKVDKNVGGEKGAQQWKEKEHGNRETSTTHGNGDPRERNGQEKKEMGIKGEQEKEREKGGEQRM